MQLINAKIYTMCEGIIDLGYITISDEKIIDVGEMSSYNSDGTNVYDAGGCPVLPGLIDGHCHLGMFGDSLGFEGDDGNEATDPLTPHLRAIDAINAMDRCFSDALDAGITAVVTGPGSANPIAGMSAVIKTHGVCIDDMIIKAPAAMKFALGENPKTVYHGKNQTPETRMATSALIRDMLRKAKKYMLDVDKAANSSDDDEIDPPEYDAKCEALIPLLRRDMKAHFHAHRSDDIFTAQRIAREFEIDFALVHCTEGHLIADKVAQSNSCVFVGPNLCDRAKPELSNLDITTAAVLHKAGVDVAIVTDHPVIPIQYLTICAALAVKGGLDEYEALRAITINPARIMGLGDRVGAIAVGMDADIAVYDGNPLEIQTKIKKVIVNGQIVRG